MINPEYKEQYKKFLVTGWYPKFREFFYLIATEKPMTISESPWGFVFLNATEFLFFCSTDIIWGDREHIPAFATYGLPMQDNFLIVEGALSFESSDLLSDFLGGSHGVLSHSSGIEESFVADRRSVLRLLLPDLKSSFSPGAVIKTHRGGTPFQIPFKDYEFLKDYSQPDEHI